MVKGDADVHTFVRSLATTQNSRQTFQFLSGSVGLLADSDIRCGASSVDRKYAIRLWIPLRWCVIQAVYALFPRLTPFLSRTGYPVVTLSDQNIPQGIRAGQITIV